MKRKNKSIKIVKMPLLNALGRKTTLSISSPRVDQELHALQDIAYILEEILEQAFEDISFSTEVIQKYAQLESEFQDLPPGELIEVEQ